MHLKPRKLPTMDGCYFGSLTFDTDINRAGADPTATTEPTESASGTATKAMNVATTQSTSGATATAAAAPALAVMAGLGMQLINMNL